MQYKKTLLIALISFCLPPSQAYSSIMYNVSPRHGESAPWALLGGTITTDGTIGEISPLNFERWELTFSSPAGVSEISSNDGGALLIVETLDLVGPLNELCCQRAIKPTMTATADELLLFPGFLGALNLYFTNQDILSGAFAGKLVSFSPRSSESTLFGGTIIDNTVDSFNPHDPFRVGATLIPGQRNNPNRAYLIAPSGPLVVGTVASIPEPSTGLLLVATSICTPLRKRVLVVAP